MLPMVPWWLGLFALGLTCLRLGAGAECDPRRAWFVAKKSRRHRRHARRPPYGRGWIRAPCFAIPSMISTAMPPT